jgi:hypothetical protein
MNLVSHRLSDDARLGDPAGGKDDGVARVLQQIRDALAGLRFGSIEIVVHEGQVTQIERKEKFRLQQTLR